MTSSASTNLRVLAIVAASVGLACGGVSPADEPAVPAAEAGVTSPDGGLPPPPAPDAGAEEEDDTPTADDDASGTGRPIVYWTDGVIPFEVDASIGSAAAIDVAVATINRETRIHLRPRVAGDADYVVFRATAGPSSRSALGRRGGSQSILLSARGVDDPATVMHEIGHAIGLVHEQQRPDRDAHVTVRYECIKSGYQKQFDLNGRIRAEQQAEPFDFGSIMLYGSRTFATSKSCPTMVRRADGRPFSGLGQAGALTPGIVRVLDAIAAAR